MPRKKSPEDLTVEELRRLLVEKRRSSRQDRLEYFRKTGRIVSIAPDFETSSLDELRTSPLPEYDSDEQPQPRQRRRRALDGFLLLVEILAVLGLVFVLEGLVLALAPSRIDEILRLLAQMPVETRRMLGLLAITSGGILLWLANWLGA